MLLSVIIPEAPKGTMRMLERELDGIDAEIIIKRWDKGLSLATGEFVCLLEEDSAVKYGSIRNNLEIFTTNPLFRKLAMVTSPVDYSDDSRIVFSFTEAAQRRFDVSSTSTHQIRVGSVPGAVMRRSSLIKLNHKFTRDILNDNMNICLDFWEAGQRILLNPDSLYYAPEVEHSFASQFKPRQLSPTLTSEWQRELVS